MSAEKSTALPPEGGTPSRAQGLRVNVHRTEFRLQAVNARTRRSSEFFSMRFQHAGGNEISAA